MLKKFGFLTGAAAVPAAFAPALAADLPVRAPAPAPVFTVAPFSWDGFYVGLNAGVITAKTELRGRDLGGDSYCWSDDCSYNRSASHTGGIFGAQLGYNFQFGQIVLGAEADIGWSGANKSWKSTGWDDYTFGKTGVSALGTARLRLGYAFDRAMVYATGGLAFGRTNGVGDGYAYEFNASNVSKAGDGWRTGWAVGAGVEYAINNNWSVKAEGLYYDLGSKSGVSVGTFAGETYQFRSGVQSDVTGVVARLGINYRFGGRAAGPVVARY